MGMNTLIQWCMHTFNCWRGCAKISPGCENCYAWFDSKRFPKIRGIWGVNGTRVCPAEATWREPFKWDRAAAKAGERHRVFCASLADVLEDWGGQVQDHNESLGWTWGGAWPWCFQSGAKAGDDGRFRELRLDDLRHRLFALIHETRHLDWLFVTKRPENAAKFLPEKWFASWPVNVWFGVTVEDKEFGLPRMDLARTVPAAIRFLSVEPLIEDLGELNLDGIGWVIVGGESGPKARPFDIAWARSIVAQCKAAGVPVFVKQLGARPYDSSRCISIDGPDSHAIELDLIDSHGGDMDEWPHDLRVRELPTLEDTPC